MNSRWKELNEEAEKYALSKVNSAGYCFETNMYIGSLVKMKLAELIIQECCEVAREWEDDYVVEDTAPSHVDIKIKKHFGVE